MQNITSHHVEDQFHRQCGVVSSDVSTFRNFFPTLFVMVFFSIILISVSHNNLLLYLCGQLKLCVCFFSLIDEMTHG